ncbi:hypothetical protein BVC80_1293g1 [Macleaya cordata]|uniref:Uncharacterized protein n=1 Tax=Macleaya cordata TaxID=56857 RepID=A0A200QDN7_MACCD|nr:hypothetical protein BVC80_1293g1 [Macleaya cordata]
MGQLATVVGERGKGKFPSQPVPNPKGHVDVKYPSNLSSRKHIQAITTLRYGRQNKIGLLHQLTQRVRVLVLSQGNL